jgi:hypothetical protein
MIHEDNDIFTLLLSHNFLITKQPLNTQKH